MDTKDTAIGTVAVKIATNGENIHTGRVRLKVNWDEFLHFIGIWAVTWLILFCTLVIITIANNEKQFIRDTIKTVDMLNMSFSLVLSAMLEQIWSKESTRNQLHRTMLGFEVFLTIIGGMLYVSYSIVSVGNQLLQKSFELNLGYAIASSVIVALGFLSRSLDKKV